MKKLAVFVLLFLLAHVRAMAGAGYYLVSTYENEGEKNVDFKFWAVKPPGSSAITAPEIGIGYSPTKRWYTELYITYIRTEYTGTNPGDVTWQNDFMLTHGQYPFDLALHTNIERHHDSANGYGFEFGPVLQTDVGRTQLNGNLFFERNYRGAQANAMQMKYQWQVKYRWRPQFAFGLQGFGELGQWNDWASHDLQSHRIGPAVFGVLPLGNGQALKYEAAYFIGSIYTQNAKVFSARVQYAF